jgi:hypothetical protein
MEVITAEEHGILLKFSDFENFLLARHDCLVNHLHAAAIQGTPFKQSPLKMFSHQNLIPLLYGQLCAGPEMKSPI